MLDDLPICNSCDINASKLNVFSGGGNAHEYPCVRAGHGDTRDNFITFSNQVFEYPFDNLAYPISMSWMNRFRTFQSRMECQA